MLSSGFGGTPVGSFLCLGMEVRKKVNVAMIC